MCAHIERRKGTSNRSWCRETLAPKARSSACLHLLSRAGTGHLLLSRFSSPHSLPLCSLSPSSLFGIPLLALLVVLGVTLADLFILTILLSFDPGLRHNFDWHRGRVRGGSFRTVWHRTSNENRKERRVRADSLDSKSHLAFPDSPRLKRRPQNLRVSSEPRFDLGAFGKIRRIFG